MTLQKDRVWCQPRQQRPGLIEPDRLGDRVNPGFRPKGFADHSGKKDMRETCPSCGHPIGDKDDQVSYDLELAQGRAESREWPTEDVIGPFRDEYYYLSNFHWATVRYDGVEFPTAEHAYQATKARDQPEVFEKISTAESPGDAKRLGQDVSLPADWNEQKKYRMLEIVTAKFTQNPSLRDRLLGTGTALLIELNWWDDQYWGADVDTGEGANMLGRILMQVRTTLKAITVE